MESIRLQKFMAECGVASRRKCEEIISQRRVSVNGETVTEPGTKVYDSDTVKVDGEVLHRTVKKVYIALNKPVGYVTTVSDQFGRPTVLDLVFDEIHTRIFPVGRLDYDTEGLLLLTNDGDITYKLTHPKHTIFKTYRVVLNDIPNPREIERLKNGVLIDGRKTRPAKLNWLKDNLIEISISEGRNRQIRKMFESIGYTVVGLKRVSVGNISLGNIPLGRWRHLTPSEIKYLSSL